MNLNQLKIGKEFTLKPTSIKAHLDIPTVKKRQKIKNSKKFLKS
jgi:hypothetical protein